jgi:hypothetical protein
MTFSENQPQNKKTTMKLKTIKKVEILAKRFSNQR